MCISVCKCVGGSVYKYPTDESTGVYRCELCAGMSVSVCGRAYRCSTGVSVGVYRCSTGVSVSVRRCEWKNV